MASEDPIKDILLTLANAIHKAYGPSAPAGAGRAPEPAEAEPQSIEEAVEKMAESEKRVKRNYNPVTETKEIISKDLQEAAEDASDRSEELLGRDVRTLRKLLAAADPESDTKGQSKSQVVALIVALEKLTGHSVEELAEGEKESEPEPEDIEDDEDLEDAEDDTDDDDEDGYTVEELKSFKLPQLKAIAKENGVPVEDLKGLDSDEVIQLLLGEETEDDDDQDVEDDDDDEEEIEVSDEDIREMSIPELKSLIKVIGLDIQVKRGVSQEDLAEEIIEAVS